MASRAAPTVITIATRLAFQPKAPCRPCARSTWSATLKAMYVNSMANSATMTPRKPNWARDWIICGSPSVGPWVACRAMKQVPTRIPAVPATIVHARERPNDGPMKPIGMVKYWKLPRNHSGAWCHTLPCRSLYGIQSIERVSMPWMPAPRVRTGASSLAVTASSPLVRRNVTCACNVTVGDVEPRVNSVLYPPRRPPGSNHDVRGHRGRSAVPAPLRGTGDGGRGSRRLSVRLSPGRRERDRSGRGPEPGGDRGRPDTSPRVRAGALGGDEHDPRRASCGHRLH